MGRRQQLNQLFKTFTPNVYFQPPEDVKLVYPAIVYKRDYAETKHADNKVYSFTKRYQVTVISRESDDEIVDLVAFLPQTTYIRYFAAEQLHHDILNIFF